MAPPVCLSFQVLPVRRIFHLEDVITRRHLDKIAKLILATGLMLAYSYMCETFIAWYSGDQFERYTYLFARPQGPYAWIYWAMTAANVLTPQLFWFRRLRTNVVVLFMASVLIWAAMWAERFVIIVTSLNRDFLPSSWHFYTPSWVDWGLLIGSIGVFFVLFFAFLRWVPFVPVSEVKRLRFETRREARLEEARGGHALPEARGAPHIRLTEGE